MKKSQAYPTHVYWDERDQGFVALAPDLPGCSAFGKTKAKALRELERAIEAWIETSTAAGDPVPEPSPLPKPSGYSGKMLLRIPSSLHERLAKDAASEGVSLNQWMVTLLSSGAVFRSRSTSTQEHHSAWQHIVADAPIRSLVVVTSAVDELTNWSTGINWPQSLKVGNLRTGKSQFGDSAKTSAAVIYGAFLPNLKSKELADG